METKEMNRTQTRRPRPQEDQRKKRPAGDHPPKARPEGAAAPRSGVQQRENRPRPQDQREHRRSPEAKPPRKKTAPPAKKPIRPRREPDDTLSSKPRAYGKSKPKKKSALAQMGGSMVSSIQHSMARARAKRNRPNKGGHPQQPTPAVIYTEPKAFNRNRFAVQMITVAAVVVAMVLGLSVFFKVKTITVTGAEVYSAWAVREASGIQEGDNLLSFGNARAVAKIKANLPYVDEVRIGIKLPDTVNIIIKEEEVVYAIRAKDGLWWLITSDGRVVEQSLGGNTASYTQILGVTLEDPISGSKAVASENTPLETLAEGETRPVVVTGAQRLAAALEILKALEANDIVGEAASVDMNRMENITLWYGNRYQVNLGDTTQLAHKIDCMNDVILQLKDYQSGMLDISFTLWPDRVVYTPFA